MRRKAEPATALRSALESPWPLLREAAVTLIQQAIKAETVQQAADELGVHRSMLSKLRRDFPEVFEAPKKRSR